MSHFAVLVIGDVDSQLEKYDENIVYPRYVKGELSEEDKNDFMDYYRKNEPRLGEASFEEMYAEFGGRWNDNEWEKHGDVWVRTSTYNPNSKWDWYVVGGRWNNLLMLKPDSRIKELMDSLGLSIGEVEALCNLKNRNLAKFHAMVDKYVGKSDQVKLLISLANTLEENKIKRGNEGLKKEIDFEGMRLENKRKALEYYDLVASCFENNVIPKLGKTFSECLSLCEDDEKAREMYNSQNAIMRLEEAREQKLSKEQAQAINGFYFDIKTMELTRDEYGERAYKNGIPVYSVVINGEWYEKGEMGWWGMSNDKMTQEEWSNKVNELLDTVDDESTISIVDCHI